MEGKYFGSHQIGVFLLFFSLSHTHNRNSNVAQRWRESRLTRADDARRSAFPRSRAKLFRINFWMSLLRAFESAFFIFLYCMTVNPNEF